MKKILLLALAAMLALPSLAFAKPAKGYSIALLDASNDNTWRVQMEAQMKKVAEQYKSQGIVSRYMAFSANNDANVQSQQLAQLVNQGVDCVIIDPVSSTALNPTIDKAIARGVLVIAVDSGIEHPSVYNIVADQANYARVHAEWFVKKLGGKGNVIWFNAIPGVPANDERAAVYKEVLAKNPGIKVLATENHSWSTAEAKQKMSQLLAAYPSIDGVLTQECSSGIVQAFAEAGRAMPKAISSGEAIEDLRTWDKYKFSSLMVENPPAVGAHGMMIAVRLLDGKKLDPAKLQGRTLKMKQNLVIDDGMRADWMKKTASMKDSEYIDSLMTEAQIDALFLK